MRITPRRERTVRELGGEIWFELSKHVPDADLPWQKRSDVVDLVMSVLARHSGATIVNDPDLPVTPLPLEPADT